jgi:DNA polymerase-3 subunit delta
MGFVALNSNTENFSDFKKAVETVSMFAEKKLIVLKNFISSREFTEKFLSWKGINFLKDTADVICIFHEEEADKKSEIFAWLVKNSKSQEFNILKGAQLWKWTQKFSAQRGIKIEKYALSRILDHASGDLWSFENEINKLTAYANHTNSSGREISNSDVDIFLRPALQTHIFFLVDAFIESNISKAVRLLRGHIEAGDNGIYLFSMIYNQFRNVIQAQAFLENGENNISKNANLIGVHPYVAKKSAAQARRFDKGKIKKAFSRLKELDVDIKTGKLEPLQALEDFILES